MKKFLLKIKFKERIWLYVLLLTILIVVPITLTNGRYFISKLSEFYYDSKEFYFYSNVLNGSTYNLSNWDGTSNYELTIDTSNAKDNLNWTKEDITYVVSTTCASSNTNVTVSCAVAGTSTLVTNETVKTIGSNTITISKTGTLNVGDTITIEVTATSTSTYAKSLTATFVVTINQIGLTYNIIDSVDSRFLTLVIANTGTSKYATIAIDATALNIDSTNYYVRNGVTATALVGTENIINSLTFQVLGGNVYSIRFYKNDPSINYTLNTSVLNIS